MVLLIVLFVEFFVIVVSQSVEAVVCIPAVDLAVCGFVVESEIQEDVRRPRFWFGSLSSQHKKEDAVGVKGVRILDILCDVMPIVTMEENTSKECRQLSTESCFLFHVSVRLMIPLAISYTACFVCIR